MKIAFCGFDIFSAVLDGLIDSGAEIIKIYTCETDNITEFNSHVKEITEKGNIPIKTRKVTNEDLEWLDSVGCDAFFCAGYYYKIPITDKFPMINFHPAYLPIGRGLWPMAVAILEGHHEYGVTFHKMTNELDAGDIILQEKFSMNGMNHAELLEKINEKAYEMTKELYSDFQNLYQNATPQGDYEYWKNPKEEDYVLNGSENEDEIKRILNAFYGYYVHCQFNEREKLLLLNASLEKKPEHTEYIEIGKYKIWYTSKVNSCTQFNTRSTEK